MNDPRPDVVFLESLQSMPSVLSQSVTTWRPVFTTCISFRQSDLSLFLAQCISDKMSDQAGEEMSVEDRRAGGKVTGRREDDINVFFFLLKLVDEVDVVVIVVVAAAFVTVVILLLLFFFSFFFFCYCSTSSCSCSFSSYSCCSSYCYCSCSSTSFRIE